MNNPLQTVLDLPDINNIVEIGCCQLEDTAVFRRQWPKAVIWCFEADPRNTIYIQASGMDAVLNVRFQPVAISDQGGVALFYLSHPWNKSSSLLRPKRCSLELVQNSSYTFLPHPVEVRTMTLDHALPRQTTDLIWMDVQGAEAKVILGATETLKHTRYLFLEHNTCGDYEDAPDLQSLLPMLPDWQVVEQWPYDVLLKHA